MIINKKGQSTVEYILLATAVIGAMIVFATNKDAGLQSKLTDTLGTSTNTIANMTGRLKKSQEASDAKATPAQAVIVFDPATGFNSTP